MHISLRKIFFPAAACCIAAIFAEVNCTAEDSAKFASTVDETFVADHDGTKQKYVVMTPPEMIEGKPVSVLIVLHGHGSDRWQFVKQSRGECRAARDAALEHRMLLVSPDYRARTSWMGPAAEADLVQIIQTLKQKYNVQRIILSGGSMGGTGALTFSARHPEMIDGVVSLNGTANLVEYERFQDAIAASFGGTRELVPDEYRKRSAEFYPTKFTMPLAATTGGKDEVVPAASVLRLVDQIQKHNSNVLSIHRKEGGHSTTYADSKQAFEFVIQATNPKSE
ncbi:alpha/beta fold hydrolase [Thalassoglobus polymorphus]|nr:alpha/beta fold hydrolase [Thalassoglobus polymorphus]